jgi:hypothetical protein
MTPEDKVLRRLNKMSRPWTSPSQPDTADGLVSSAVKLDEAMERFKAQVLAIAQKFAQDMNITEKQALLELERTLTGMYDRLCSHLHAEADTIRKSTGCQIEDVYMDAFARIRGER